MCVTTRGSSDGGIHHHHHHYVIVNDGNETGRTLWLHGNLFVVFHVQFLVKPSHQVAFVLQQLEICDSVLLQQPLQDCFHGEKKTYCKTGVRKKWTEISTVAKGQRSKPVEHGSSAERRGVSRVLGSSGFCVFRAWLLSAGLVGLSSSGMSLGILQGLFLF